MNPSHLSPGAAPGSALYWRINLALFLAGFASFSLLYGVQPLLPVFARVFGVGAAASSLALSLSTGSLALSIFCAGAWSQGRDRRRLMAVSMVTAAGLNLLAAQLSDWHGFLLARTLAGVALGGVPAVALAYLAEEIEPRGLGFSTGLYVGGTAFGGMAGRVLTGWLSDLMSWSAALTILGFIGLLASLGFFLLLPASHRPRQPAVGWRLAEHGRIWRDHLAHPGLPWLFAVAFLGMGTFVTLYNYAGFRLMAPPFGLSATQVGLIFCAYVAGIASSSLAGWLADRFGPAPVMRSGILIMMLGVGLTCLNHLALVITGVVVLTSGFFMAHAVASGWVGRLAGAQKGHASSLYLLAYYLGSSLLGSAGGWAWQHGGWAGVSASALACLALMAACAFKVRRGGVLQPVAQPGAT